MPEELKSAVQAAADASGRSLHAELLHRIQKSFQDDENDQTTEMLYEMRRTQLHLELNALRAGLSSLFARGQDVRVRRESDEIDLAARAAAQDELHKIADEKSDIDAKARDVLARLTELDRAHAQRKSSSPLKS